MTNEEIIREIKSNNRVQENMYLLYSQNMPLLRSWSKKYNAVIGEEDVLQECYIALHKAVQGFDENKGYKFVTYLQSAVKTHFIGVFGNKINNLDRKLLRQYNVLSHQWKQITGTDITIHKTSNLLHCSQNDIQRILQYVNLQNCESIDAPITNNANDKMNVAEVLPDKTNIEKDFEHRYIKEQLIQVWDYVHNICTEQEESILLQRFKENKKYSEIGVLYGFSNTYARDIQNKALSKLKRNGKFLKWAKSFDYCADMAYHYGFNTWKNNGASAVEMASEVRERYKNWMTTKEQREIEKQKSIILSDMISRGLLPADCQCYM